MPIVLYLVPGIAKYLPGGGGVQNDTLLRNTAADQTVDKMNQVPGLHQVRKTNSKYIKMNKLDHY